MSAEIRKLENGLTVIAETKPYLKSVAINVMVKVGSRNEPEDLNGISHVIEHMAYKGTAKRTAQEIAIAFDDIGGNNNAYTFYDVTSYHCKTRDANWKTAIELLSDIVLNSNYPQIEFEKELDVVLQEIAKYKDMPDDIANDMAQELSFSGQALGRTILGTEETVSRLTRYDLINFVAKHYQPGNMVVSAAGNITIDELVAEVEKLFVFQSVQTAPVAPQASYKGGICTRKQDFEQTYIVMGFEGASYTSPDYYTQQILVNILGGGMSSRLFQELREKRGLAYSIGAAEHSFEDTGLFQIIAEVDPKNFRESVKIILAELRKVSENLSDKEVGRCKQQVIDGLTMSAERNTYCAEQNAKAVLVYGGYVTDEEIFAKIESITTSDVTSFAAKIFSRQMTLAAVGEIENLTSFAQVVDEDKSFRTRIDLSRVTSSQTTYPLS